MANLAAVSDASDAEQIELEDSLVAYLESHADATPADLLRAVGDAFVGNDGTRIALGVGEARPEVAADVKRSQKIRRCRVGMRLAVRDEGVL